MTIPPLQYVPSPMCTCGHSTALHGGIASPPPGATEINLDPIDRPCTICRCERFCISLQPPRGGAPELDALTLDAICARVLELEKRVSACATQKPVELFITTTWLGVGEGAVAYAPEPGLRLASSTPVLQHFTGDSGAGVRIVVVSVWERRS